MSLNKNFHRLYLAGFFAILLLPVINAIPFFSLPLWLSPPDFAKTIIFRIIFSVILFIFICQALYKKSFDYQLVKKLKSISVYFWLLTGLFLFSLLSTIFSKDILHSFWGDPQRAGGFLNFGFYIVFCIFAFLIIKNQDWQKIWDFTIIIGILVSVIAVFQQFKILSSVFIPTSSRPGSTIGTAVLLSLYLLFLFFMSLSFFLKEKNIKKRLFYLFSLLLFLFILIIDNSRSTWLALILSSAFFLFFYPKKLIPEKWRKPLLILKITFFIVLFLSAVGFFYLNAYHEQIIMNPHISKNPAVIPLLDRLTLKSALQDSRFSVWQIAAKAVAEKPILGWGPENFSIAFDKYYDPSISNIGVEWYDKAHNFLLDISVTSGAPAAIIYLLIFGALFYELQKIKKNQTENYLISHGLQAVFLGYIVNVFFDFDNFSTYLILFLLVAFSLKLMSDLKLEKETNEAETGEAEKNFSIKTQKYKTLILLCLFVFLVLFIWLYNIKSLAINADMNAAQEERNCQVSLPQMEKVLSSSGTYLNHYLGVNYGDMVNSCIKVMPLEKSIETVKKAIPVLEKNTQIRPTYTRDWLFLGIYNNFLLENSNDSKAMSELKDKSDYYFKKALELSPKRQLIFAEWAKTYYVIKDYLKAKEISQQCLDISQTMGQCWWMQGVSNLNLDNLDEAKNDIAQAQKNGYSTDSESSLIQLSRIYLDKKNYQELLLVNLKLALSYPKKMQYWATLAYNYKIIGDYKNARKFAQKILELFPNNPEIQKQVNDFLKTLP